MSLWPVYVGNQKVGEIDTARQTLIKRVLGSKHRLRQPPAWAVARSVLDEARRSHVVWVEMQDEEALITYRARLSDFFDHGFAVNRGYEAQLGLSLDYWRVVREVERVEQPSLL